MKITRKQLRKLISETIYSHPKLGNIDASKSRYDYLSGHSNPNISDMADSENLDDKRYAEFMSSYDDDSDQWKEMEAFSKDIFSNFRSEEGSLTDGSNKILQHALNYLESNKDNLLEKIKHLTLPGNEDVNIFELADSMIEYDDKLSDLSYRLLMLEDSDLHDVFYNKVKDMITGNKILKELLNTSSTNLDSGFNLDDIIYPSDGDIPPPDNQSPGGGGGSNCEPGSARYERIYDKVINAYEPWLMSTFPENNHEHGQYGEYANHLLKLGVDPEDYGRHIIRGFITIMELIVDHLCLNGGNMYKLFNDPRPAL